MMIAIRPESLTAIFTLRSVSCTEEFDWHRLTVLAKEQHTRSSTGEMEVRMSTDRLTQTKHYQECIAACFACAQTCETCSDDMIGMDHHGDQKLMAQCIRLCRECTDICVLAGRWMSQGSAMSDRLCGLCADICDSCAEVCEQHAPHHALCGPCATECRRCAELCRKMIHAAA